MITYPTNKLQKVLLSGRCEQRNLPSEYTQVEYLRNENNAYINTGIEWDNTIEFEVKQTVEAQDTGSHTSFGSYNTFTPKGRIVYGVATYFGLRVMNTFVSGQSQSSGSDIGVAIGLTGTLSLKGDTISWSEGSSASFDRGEAFNVDIPITLFGVNSGSLLAHYKCSMYYAKFWMQGVLVFNGVPCKRNSDNVLGMYDTVSGNFFTNAGTGDFTAGADVVPTPDYPMDIVCNNGVVKISKNLFNKNGYINAYINAKSKVINKGTTQYCFVIQIKPNTTYTLSGMTAESTWGSFVSQDIGTVATTSIQGNGTITTGAEDKYLIGLAFTSSSLNYTDTLQVEQGTSATPYHPYGQIYTDGTQEVVTDNLGNTANAEMLLSVGDYKDIQSVLDGGVTRNVGIKVLDGTENWRAYSDTITGLFYSENAITDNKIGASLFALMSNQYIVTDSSTLEYNYSIQFQKYDEKSTVASHRLYVRNTNYTTASNWTQYLADQYANGTPVIIVYPLATSVTEQVTPQPLAGSTATITAGSIDNLPIESNTIAELKKRYIGTTPVGRVYIGNNLIWETKEGYGVRWIHGDTSGAVERIGNMEYHRTLPIQSNMRRCIRKENGDIQYISDSDWTKDIDGNIIDYNAEGQDIMVEVPEHYYQAYQKVENGVTYDYLILYPTVRFGKKVPKHYLGAFKAMLNRDTNKLYSTVKIDTNSLYDSNGDANGSNFTYPANASTYRGGDNDTTYDDTGKTLFGRLVSNISITNFCTYAKNRGNGYALKHWESHWCLWRLFVVEYATLNCQDTFTETLTTDGYHQGGLGFGLCSTTDAWSSYNNYNPIAPCGITLRLGSKTGIVKYTLAEQYSNDAYFEVPSYRGVENPFADIWEITNGLYIVGADSKNYIMTADNGWYVRNFNYGSTSTPITGFTSRTADKNLGLVSGWPTDFIWDSHGDIIPTVINTTAANTEDNTSPFRDYFWGTNKGAKRALLGGSLHSGVRAGLASLNVTYGVGHVRRHHGSRLLYIPPVSN